MIKGFVSLWVPERAANSLIAGLQSEVPGLGSVRFGVCGVDVRFGGGGRHSDGGIAGGWVAL